MSEVKHTHTEEGYEDDIKFKILEASLPFVHEHGWSKTTISAGAESLGYPGITHGLFPRGGADLVNHFQKRSNEKLVDSLKKRVLVAKPDSGRVIVQEAVKNRLEMIVPYLARWPQAIAIMSLPQNVSTSLATLLTMTDDICYYAGDRSVDFNWYARRVALAGLYKATELYLIQDTSPDFEKSWKFLDNRLAELSQVHNLVTKADAGGFGSADAIKSAFTTARNIIGLN
ncbi:hypothetical protein RN001_014716 [Aquatica leii]|uniref:Ubiquinone biosynthesis protein n=1 Tax=Aquatica leii TaxID=1421715 RepID=A0AAN7SBL2_9COLE|nr:hypothetical protein RN001_014716 [Aquatica leii]